MNKAIATIATALVTLTASPALADDSAIDTETMLDAAAPKSHQPVTLPVDGFDLNELTGSNDRSLMVTTAKGFEPGYRVNNQDKGFPAEPAAGLEDLFIPQEYSFRSGAQDSGVDAVTPGQFRSSSVRPDYLTDTGPGAIGNSSVGVRIGF